MKYVPISLKNIYTVRKVAFIILSPSAIEASHSWLMRQFELYAIITQPIALMSYMIDLSFLR